MKISYNWLKQYIDVELPVKELADILTNCGLEVESVEKYETIKGGLENIFVGKVVSCEKHPDADRLHVTTVDVGKDTLLNIVCGAANVAAGQHVLVATLGAVLYPTEGEPFTIKQSKIRGVVSEGMICAEDELGIGISHEGIMVLGNDSKIGMPASEYFNIETDFVFEIGLTPNRSDATSHVGVARDIVAVINAHFPQKIKLNLPAIDSFPVSQIKNPIEICVEDFSACPRYTGVYISGINIKESPEWLKTKLNAIGIRPINNVVDITQYVLFELGQPLHAFDAAKIKGNKVCVKKLAKGTAFVTLDDVERKLDENDLMICNAEQPMCIAGVMGGKDSGITEQTTDMFLESAYFDPISVRKTSKHHGLKTDASFRYERGCDPNITLYALQRAALLIRDIAGGEISSVTDVYPNPILKKEVSFKYENLKKLAGVAFEETIVDQILTSLEIEIKEKTNNGLLLSIPTNKTDVTREADVIEEFLRIYGYNNIPLPDKFTYAPSTIAENRLLEIREKISNYLSDNGFFEIINNSLSKSTYSDFSFIDKQKTVSLLNPLSRDLQDMRQTLFFGGMESIAHNINHARFDLKLYEFGVVYQKDIHKNEQDTFLERFVHRNMLAVFTTGKEQEKSWQGQQNDADFFSLKNTVLNVLNKNRFNVKAFKTSVEKSEAFDYVLIYSFKDNPVALIGKVSKSMLKFFGIKQDVFYAEIDCDKLLKTHNSNNLVFKELERFPEVHRDLALLINKQVSYEEIEQIAFKTEKKLLRSVNLFDVYEGKNLEENKKSYAVSFVLYHPEKTLTNEEINDVMDRLIAAYEKHLGAKLR